MAFLILCLGLPLSAQKVLQIETYGNPKTKKIYIGDEITYRLEGQETFQTYVIENILVDQNLLAVKDRYVPVGDIIEFRREQTWSRALGRQLIFFGLAWSGFALVGTLTDGNPDTSYGWGDAVVTGSSAVVGLTLPLVFKYKTVKFGKRRRLRVLDLTFER